MRAPDDRVVFRHKAVRDLHWVMSAPHLLTPAAGVPVLSDAWCADLCERAMPWLCELDKQPTVLESWLRSQRNVRRLGFYFAALLEFWIRHCPALALSGGATDVLTQQQVHAGIDGQCAGQLKLVFRRADASGAAELAHWESHVKFFAFCPEEEDSSADREAALADADDACLAAYVGPFLGENLLHRVVELRRKLSLSDAPAVRSFLAAHFAGDKAAAEPSLAAPHAHLDCRSESVVRGYLFYPLLPNGNAGVAVGSYVSEACGPPATATCGAVSPAHSRGWWTRSLDELLGVTDPRSLWALPGNGAGVREDARGHLGGKLHWLAPAVAFGDASQGGGSSIRGIPSLGVEDCPLITPTELAETLSGLHPSALGANEDGSSPAALLLLQMLPHDASSEAGGESDMWVEVSRGFLMPPDWDPTPLRRAQPLGLRSGMRQKQKAGVAMIDADYREADEAFTVSPDLLAIRCGAEGGFGPRATDGAVETESLAADSNVAGMAGVDSELVEAVLAEVGSAWRGLAPAVHSQLLDLIASVLTGCAICEREADAPPGENQVTAGGMATAGEVHTNGALASFELGVRSLFDSMSSTSGDGGKSGGGKSGQGKGGKVKGGGKGKGGANSLFAVAKTTIAHSVAKGGHLRGSVLMLRRVFECGGEQLRLLGSLLLASLASCSELRRNDAAAIALSSLLTDAMRGLVSVPTSLIVDAVTMFDVRAEPSGSDTSAGVVAPSWPPLLRVETIAGYVRPLLDGAGEEEPTAADLTLRNVSQLLRQLRVLHLHLVDQEALIRRLVDANLWLPAEQLAVSASEEMAARRASEEAKRQGDDNSPPIDISENGGAGETREEDFACYLELQKAAKAATVGTVLAKDGARGEESDQVHLNGTESVQRVAAALGGYIKRSERLLDRSPSPPRGASDSSAGCDIRDVPCSDSPCVGDHASARDEEQALLRLLLTLAHQRANAKLVAKLTRLVDAAGGADSLRTSQLSRLVNHRELSLAVTFAGVNRPLQVHLVKLLLAADLRDAAAEVVRARHLPTSLLHHISADESLPDACTPPGDADASDEEMAAGGVAGTGGMTRNLVPYALPAGAMVECFDLAEEAAAAEAALARMHRVACSGEVLPVVGVDAEWVAGTGKPVALVQLAVPGRCVLLRVHQISSAQVPGSLRALLDDRSLLKTGVGISHDLKLLRDYLGLSASGVLDLQTLAFREGFLHAGLQRLTADVLGLHLDKRVELRCSNWEADVLTEAQRAYAAMDAHVAVDLFSRLYGAHAAGAAAVDASTWCAPLVDCDAKRSSRRQQVAQPPSVTPPPPGAPSTALAQGEAAPSAATNDSNGLALGAEEQRPRWVDPHHGAAPPVEPLDADTLIARLGALGIDAASARLVSVDAASDEDHPSGQNRGELEAGCLPVKSLAIFATGSPAVAVVSAHRKLDPFKLAKHLKLTLTSRKAMSRQVRLATPAECVSAFGYRPGTVPPLGHRDPAMPVIVDSECATSAVPLLAGGGDFGRLLRLDPAALTSQPNVSVAELSDASATQAAESHPTQALPVREEAAAAAPPPVQIMSSFGEARPLTDDGPRFLVDAMMGRLLRWLRVLGIDTLLREDGETIGEVFTRAHAEQRILLTRDRKLAERRDSGATAVFVVGSDEPREQLREVVAHFGLRLSADEFMMRCSVCNGRGYYKCDRAEAAKRDDCPPKVLETVEDFYVCRSCGKLYWEGPKSNNAFDHFSNVLDGFGAVASLEGKTHEVRGLGRGEPSAQI